MVLSPSPELTSTEIYQRYDNIHSSAVCESFPDVSTHGYRDNTGLLALSPYHDG